MRGSGCTVPTRKKTQTHTHAPVPRTPEPGEMIELLQPRGWHCPTQAEDSTMPAHPIIAKKKSCLRLVGARGSSNTGQGGARTHHPGGNAARFALHPEGPHPAPGRWHHRWVGRGGGEGLCASSSSSPGTVRPVSFSGCHRHARLLGMCWSERGHWRLPARGLGHPRWPPQPGRRGGACWGAGEPQLRGGPPVVP